MAPSEPLIERKQRQARRRIAAAAEALFAERGFDNVSVTDIAERAEVGRTTFFRHFGDKQEVAFSKERELMAMIAAAAERETEAGHPAPTTVAEAVEALRPLILELCAQAAADPDGYARHFALIDPHPELRARYAVKLSQLSDQLGELLIRRGSDPAVAVLAAHLALACFKTAKSLGNDPHTLVDQTEAAFSRLLTLGA